MLFTITYKLSQYYTQEHKDKIENENDNNNEEEEIVPHYFYQKQIILLIAGSIIYFLLMNIDVLKVLNPFYSLLIPIDLYLLKREIAKDNELYKSKTIISLDDFDNEYNLSDISANNDNKYNHNLSDKISTKSKFRLDHLAQLVYEYILHKKNKNNNKNIVKGTAYTNINTNTNTINPVNTTELIENNYEPDTMKLHEMMEHTLDNIMTKEKI